MTDEIDFVGMFQGMPPEQVKELTDRIRAAVLNEYKNFRQEKRAEPKGIREPLQHSMWEKVERHSVSGQKPQSGHLKRCSTNGMGRT
jgi:hypothetical protein